MRAVHRVATGALLCAAALCASAALAEDAKVLPIPDFFLDSGPSSKLDPEFLGIVNEASTGSLARRVHDELSAAFKDRTGVLDRHTAGYTFALSFNISRATSYRVDKGNGNADLVATVSGSLYFTNAVTGEVLITVARTTIGRAVIAAGESQSATLRKMFQDGLNSLMHLLAADGARVFNPVRVEAKVAGSIGDLIVLDAGYTEGIQNGDKVEDTSGNLLSIVYAGQHYAAAQIVVADSPPKAGAVFAKYLAHAADGRIKPRVVILVDEAPEGYPRQYLAQLFGDALGDKAPFSILPINPAFARLRARITEESDLTLSEASERSAPQLFVRLRIGEPIISELPTNLAFQTSRNYEAVAFADVVDSGKRVDFAAMGIDRFSDPIVRGVGPEFAERREVVIKNALAALARSIAKQAETNRDQTPISAVAGREITAGTMAKAFFEHQAGVILRRARLDPGHGPQDLLLPTWTASVDFGNPAGSLRLRVGAPLVNHASEVAAGDVFEVERRGPAPRSVTAFAMCPTIEHLGALKTPYLLNLAETEIAAVMPGLLIVPGVEAPEVAVDSGFSKPVQWDSLQASLCVQAVDHVDAGAENCGAQCDRPVVAKYTLRVRSQDQVLSRTAMEAQFRSDGYFKNAAPEQIDRLLEVDLIEQARRAINKSAETVSFASGH